MFFICKHKYSQHTYYAYLFFRVKWVDKLSTTPRSPRENICSYDTRSIMAKQNQLKRQLDRFNYRRKTPRKKILITLTHRYSRFEIEPQEASGRVGINVYALMGT